MALRALCAWLIYCNDHISWSFGPIHSILFIIVWECSTILECTSVDALQPRQTPHLTEFSLLPQSERQDGQGGQIPEIRPLALARGRRKSSDHQRWFPRALMPGQIRFTPQVTQDCF